eukprot:8785051-Pyramimonas_sp.AAC.1
MVMDSPPPTSWNEGSPAVSEGEGEEEEEDDYDESEAEEALATPQRSCSATTSPSSHQVVFGLWD